MKGCWGFKVVGLKVIGVDILFFMFDFSSVIAAFSSSIAISTAFFNVEGTLALVNTFAFGVSKLIYFVRDIFFISAADVLMPSFATTIASWFLIVINIEPRSRAILDLIFKSCENKFETLDSDS